MERVAMTMDGRCLGNPGPGGWAGILRCAQHERILQGGAPGSTNNRTELTDAVEGTECTEAPVGSRNHDGLGLRAPWRTDFWLQELDKLANRDLWEELDELSQYHAVWTHVAGHSWHRDQERADKLATEAARREKQEAACA